MAAGRAIRAGQAFVEIFADSKQLTRGLRAAERKLQAFGASVRNMGAGIAAAGATAGAALTAAAGSFISFGDKLDKMSKRTGIGVKALSELKFAAEQNGATLDDVGNAVQRMNRRLGRITAGQATKTQVEALESLGLSAEKLEGLSPEERLLSIADAMAAMKDPAEAAGLAQRAFGTQVDKILPLLLQGREGIQEYRDEANRLNVTLTDEQTDAAAKFGDAWNKVKSILAAAVVQIGGALAPSLTELLNRVAEASAQVVAWIKDNKQMVVAVGAGVAAVTAFGVALVGLGTAISAAGSVFGLLAGVITALFSPITLVVGGLAALGAAIFKSTDIGQKALGFLKSAFGNLADEAGTAFGAIRDAIAAGDIKAAMKVLTSFLELQWVKVKQFLLQNVPVKGIVSQWFEIQKSWTKVTGFIVDAWDLAQTKITTGILELVSKFQQLEDKIGKLASGALFPGVSALSNLIGDVDPEFVDDEQKRLNSELQERIGRRDQERRDQLNRINEQQNKVLDGIDDAVANADENLKKARDEFNQAVEDAKNAAAPDPAVAPRPDKETTGEQTGEKPTPDKTQELLGAATEASRQLSSRLLNGTDVTSREGFERIARATGLIGPRDRQQKALDSMDGKLGDALTTLDDIERNTKQKFTKK